MVPATGLEPVRCYSLEPESSASANSATRALESNRLQPAFRLVHSCFPRCLFRTPWRAISDAAHTSSPRERLQDKLLISCRQQREHNQQETKGKTFRNRAFLMAIQRWNGEINAGKCSRLAAKKFSPLRDVNSTKSGRKDGPATLS